MKTPYVVEFVSADGKSTFQIEERVSPTRTKLWSDTYNTREQADQAILQHEDNALLSMLGYKLKGT